MASAITKPEKRLGEFLKEQQEPFILDVYLLEKGYSKKCTSSKKKPLFPFLKVLTVLHKKLSFHNQNNSNNKHTNVGVPHEDHQTVVETDRFSTASSSTMFNSCSDIDDELGTSFSPHTSQSHQDTNNGKHRQRCIKDETLDKDVSVWGIQSCGGVLVPKKITEDSLLSAALWSSLINQTAKRKNYTKKVLQMEKAKQLLFDCVKEMTINRPRKGCKQFMGPENLWKRTNEWSQLATGNETNLTKLLNFDYLDSMNEWSEFKLQVRDIGVEIADAILERVNNEIVCEIIQILPQNTLNNKLVLGVVISTL